MRKGEIDSCQVEGDVLAGQNGDVGRVGKGHQLHGRDPSRGDVEQLHLLVVLDGGNAPRTRHRVFCFVSSILVNAVDARMSQ